MRRVLVQGHSLKIDKAEKEPGREHLQLFTEGMTQGGGWSENIADLKSDSAWRGQQMMMNTGGCGGTALAVGVLCHSWHFTQRIHTKRVEI